MDNLVALYFIIYSFYLFIYFQMDHGVLNTNGKFITDYKIFKHTCLHKTKITMVYLGSCIYDALQTLLTCATISSQHRTHMLLKWQVSSPFLLLSRRPNREKSIERPPFGEFCSPFGPHRWQIRRPPPEQALLKCSSFTRRAAARAF